MARPVAAENRGESDDTIVFSGELTTDSTNKAIITLSLEDIIFESQGTSISQVVLVALVEGDDEGHTPTASGQTEVPNGILGGMDGYVGDQNQIVLPIGGVRDDGP